MLLRLANFVKNNNIIMNDWEKWFNQRRWDEGITVRPDSSINISEFYKQYQKRPDLWKLAFEFLKKDLTSQPVGRYVLKEKELISIISEYETKSPEVAKWESHRKYIDLQYVIIGKEKMGLLPLYNAVLHEEYQAENDIIFFGEQSGEYFVATSDNFFLFFPDDVHRPGLQVSGAEYVKKLVIKIAFLE